MMELNLLEKTELRITDINLESANLTDVANTVADVLKLPRNKVLVVDVRTDHIALDILQRTVDAEQIFGKKSVLLKALESVPGITIKPSTDVHSDGILGYIGLDDQEAKRVIERTRSVVTGINTKKRARIKVFPTGFELLEGKIKDTNTPYLVKKLEEAGYIAETGAIIQDNKDAVIESLNKAAQDYGVVITTGGVGAEDKDFTIEGIMALDPQAATPYLVKFTRGQGRHVKDGVKIGVGEYQDCLFIALPGPHDEVQAAVPVLIEGLKKNLDKQAIAQALAEVLRNRLADKAPHRHGHNHHN